MLQRLLIRSLEHSGYNVQAASDAVQALALCQNLPTKPDLLLTDVGLPGIDGSSLANKIQERWPDLKVLMISGHSDEHLSKALAANHYPMLAKPFSGEQLRAKVSALLTPGPETSG